MAEGLDPEALVQDVVGEEQEVTTPGAQVVPPAPVVRPKERAKSQVGEEVEVPEIRTDVTASTSGEWWHSSALTGPGGGLRAPTPPPLG